MKKLPTFILSFVCVLCVIGLSTPAQAEVLTKGVQSAEVLKLQEQLQARGYFCAGVTGYYGLLTEQAVRGFQKDHGLVADGIAGSATQSRLDAYGKVEEKTLDQLARIIYAEARGESFEGQVAVGAVVLNRVQSDMFPNSISEIILQPGQFTAVQDGQYLLTPNKTAYLAARQALNGVDPTNGALFYYNPKIATAKWSKSRPAIISLGRHTFTN